MTEDIKPPIEARQLAPKYGERGIFAGQTGSGKTTAMLRMLAVYYGKRQIVIFDTKSDPSIERLEGPVATHLRDLPKVAKWPEHPVVIYRPIARELADLVMLDAAADWVYRRGHTILVIDELSQFGAGAHAGAGLTSIFARGRTADITVLAGTQRPVSIPILAFTEAQLFYAFRLVFEDDRKRIARYTHPAMAIEPQTPYGVRFFRLGMASPVEYASLTETTQKERRAG